MKQSRELFLQTTKLVKRKNNNLEKFCSRRVSHIYTEREHIIIYGERERERERETSLPCSYSDLIFNRVLNTRRVRLH